MPIDTIIRYATCNNEECGNLFIKEYPNHKFCCGQCAQETKARRRKEKTSSQPPIKLTGSAYHLATFPVIGELNYATEDEETA